MLGLTVPIDGRSRHPAGKIAFSEGLHNDLVERQGSCELDDTIAMTVRVVRRQDGLKILEQQLPDELVEIRGDPVFLGRRLKKRPSYSLEIGENGAQGLGEIVDLLQRCVQRL